MNRICKFNHFTYYALLIYVIFCLVEDFMLSLYRIYDIYVIDTLSLLLLLQGLQGFSLIPLHFRCECSLL